MKKFCIIFLLSIIISLTAFGVGGFSQNESTMYESNQSECLQNEYLRIHIRADSNENDAQAVKYRVRDEIVAYLTPLIAECESKTQAMQGVKENLNRISEIAERTLTSQGFSYGATAELTTETFPTRVYGEYTLPAGEYSALIVRLGKGAGDNWWCVVYPPLCFAATNTDVVYKSKIKEIIDRFYD